ncbi:MAG: kinase [Actinomycetota bacterium]|nr:kinase [Actinomycetota bacterium]
MRSVLLLAHTGRPGNADAARRVVERLQEAGVEVRVLPEEAADVGLSPAGLTGVVVGGSAQGVELVLVLGGDGTILRAAEIARDCGVPLLGVNLGRVGFLAAAESEEVDATVERVLARDYRVEERTTLEVTVRLDGQVTGTGWALNEASVEKGARQRMLELVVEVDGRPLSRWGCDGVVCATPTGSTAYAFSAGGPIVWPGVEALLLVPISAHALFSRPLVAAPTSVFTVDILPESTPGVMWCDGRRPVDLQPGDRVVVRRGALPVHVVRLRPQPFTDRLVAKFGLPVQGWRGAQTGD